MRERREGYAKIGTWFVKHQKKVRGGKRNLNKSREQLVISLGLA